MPAQSSSSPTPLLNTVLDSIGIDIISNTLGPGQVFTLQDLCERFDISRTVAREVMRALEQRGLVTSSRRVGITVAPRSEWSFFDPLIIRWRLEADTQRTAQLHSLNELRMAIEPLAARKAADLATPEQRARLQELARELYQLGEERKGNTNRFLAADCEFHGLILEASRNEMFNGLKGLMNLVMETRTHRGLQPARPVPGAMDLHVQLADAIALGEADQAAAVAREIIQEVDSTFGL
ncbi:FadR family transcriptional regulator [Corynebacterium uropygiale]|uniref:FadR family transcriptional regulator n=1 Tax=Corynebacterium uropygiale TaxID=1775911 RepID=A0A9X1QSJ8_9CORY|nr:FadR/GntR family transcriptional regulator [Corynebacterium uropygiale]MCF4007420.1 FadR family transcriptional regulator [Corynebacterium uropygiale]